MPNFENWIAGSREINASYRAVTAWSRIQEKPSTLTVVRVDPVTSVRTTREVVVRVEYDNESDEYATFGNSGVNQMGEAILFGIKDHPTLPDTDLRRGDTFYHDGHDFRVVNVIITHGELQFLAEAQI